MGSSPLVNTIRYTFYTALSLIVLYTIIILTLTIPVVQRGATYAHHVNPTIYQDLSNVEQFGFLPNQVQPFTVTTPDNITIYAWHILPLQVYAEHEATLTSHEASSSDPAPYHIAAQSHGLNLLLTDPNAHLVLSFHGNAAHLASGYRPQTYQNLLSLSTPTRPVHVIAFDYRGFGLSAGTPTEEGVILDSLTLLSHLTGLDHSSLNLSKQHLPNPILTIHPSRITLLGQSLGTFVSTATFSQWTLQHHLPSFRSLVLLASFPSLPELLPSYSIAGLIPPVLSPIHHVAHYLPHTSTLLDTVYGRIVDKWPTRKHLAALGAAQGVEVDVTIMHAADDTEIPWHNGRANFDGFVRAASGASLSFAANPGTEGSRDSNMGVIEGSGIQCRAHDSRPHTEICEPPSQRGDDLSGKDVGTRRASKRITWQMIRHGGHNVIPTSEQVKLAVWEALERGGMQGE